MYYRTYKTTMGRKYTVRVCEDERHERRLFHAAVVFLPLAAVLGYAAAWGLI